MKESLEAYVDDSESFLSSEEDFIKSERTVCRFERISGAILNRSKKSKVLGLGQWKGRESWPLKWLKSEKSLKIFGFHIYPDYNQTVEANWSDQLAKLRKLFFSWSDRCLETLFQRAEVIRTFALSLVWYRAQVIPLTDRWAKSFESEIRLFLWKGQPMRNMLPLETVCLPLGKGGLGIPYFRSKCDALLLKQATQLLTEILDWG